MKTERICRVWSPRGALVARRRAALAVLLVVGAARAARVRPAGGAAARLAGLLLRSAAFGGGAALGVHLVLRDVLTLIVHPQPVPPAGPGHTLLSRRPPSA